MRMKKLIYILGVVSINLMLFGALLKVFHLMGANILLAISIFLFCFGFLPLALISNYKSQEEKKYKWLYIVTFIVFGFDLIGALFKIEHWQGASLFLLIGLPLPFILFLPVYLYQTRKNKDKSVLNNLGVMFGLTFLAVFSVFLAINVSGSVLDNIAVNCLNNENSTKFYQVTTKNYPNDKVKEKAEEICSYINELKCILLTDTDNGNCLNGRIQEEYNPILLKNKFTQTSILFKGESPNKIETLKNKIVEFRELVLSSKNPSKEFIELTKSLLDVDENETQKDNWMDKEFPATHTVIILEVLSRIQSNVRFVEAEYLSLL